MKVDVATLCHAASSNGNLLDIVGAFNISYAESVPHVLPVLTLALRLILEETDEGSHVLQVRIIGTDGNELFKASQKFELGPPQIVPIEGFSHPATSLCLQFGLPHLVIRSFGAQSIEWRLDSQQPETTEFYIFPEIVQSAPEC